MGFDLEFAAVDGCGSAGSHYMHVRCFAAWEFERDRSEINEVRQSEQQSRQACGGREPKLGETGVFDVGSLRAAAANGTMRHHERERLDAGESE
jgi:hypothetical protein